MSQQSLIIIYNADATLMGKLKYGYRKLSSSGPEPACAACDITHGGLSLKESPKWLESKNEIEKHGLKVIQLHRDELDPHLKEYVRLNNIRYPTVLLQAGGDSSFRSIMTNTDLNECGGRPDVFVEALRKKGLLLPEAKAPTPSL